MCFQQLKAKLKHHYATLEGLCFSLALSSAISSALHDSGKDESRRRTNIKSQSADYSYSHAPDSSFPSNQQP